MVRIARSAFGSCTFWAPVGNVDQCGLHEAWNSSACDAYRKTNRSPAGLRAQPLLPDASASACVQLRFPSYQAVARRPANRSLKGIPLGRAVLIVHSRRYWVEDQHR